MRVLFKITALLIVVLLGGCVRSETELLESVEAKVRSDPFILAFKQNMEHAFGCKSESKVGFQELSVYMSLYSVIGLRQAEGDRTQIPTVHIIIFCHSAIVSRQGRISCGSRRGDPVTSMLPAMLVAALTPAVNPVCSVWGRADRYSPGLAWPLMALPGIGGETAYFLRKTAWSQNRVTNFRPLAWRQTEVVSWEPAWLPTPGYWR